jgi:hypothetical protein
MTSRPNDGYQEGFLKQREAAPAAVPPVADQAEFARRCLTFVAAKPHHLASKAAESSRRRSACFVRRTTNGVY